MDAWLVWFILIALVTIAALAGIVRDGAAKRRHERRARAHNLATYYGHPAGRAYRDPNVVSIVEARNARR